MKAIVAVVVVATIAYCAAANNPPRGALDLSEDAYNAAMP